jgi:hypothetical protein
MIISQMNTERAARRVQPDYKRHNLKVEIKNNKKKAAKPQAQAPSSKLDIRFGDIIGYYYANKISFINNTVCKGVPGRHEEPQGAV